MAFDGSGNYTRTNGTQTGSTLWQDRAAIAPATISASEHDAEMNDVATALTACLKADGSKAATNNLPMGGFKHTGVANATLATEYATLGQVQTGLSVNDLVVSSNTTSAALRVTQVGTGEALRVEDSANPDSTPFVVTADGDLGVGVATPTGRIDVRAATTTPSISCSATAASAIEHKMYTNDVEAPRLHFVKSRSTTPTGFTTVQDGDHLGRIWFYGSDGTINSQAALIESRVDGTPGSTNIPGRLVFHTKPSGSPVAERMRITSAGNVGINNSNPTARLHVVGQVVGGASIFDSGNIELNSEGSGDRNTFIDFHAKDGTDYEFRIIRNGGTNGSTQLTNLGTGTIDVIQNTGGVRLTAGATSWAAISDEREKDIIEPIADGVEKVKTLRAVIGKYKIDPEDVRRPFLIAQDVEAVLPEAVTVSSDEQQTKYLRITDVLPLLVSAIQELSSKVEALESRLAALEEP